MNRIDLEGRRAVVTGGAQGIGRAIDERFLASGAHVAIWYRDAALLAETAAELSRSGTVYSFATDVSRARDVEAATSGTVAAMGGIDILVANAGIIGRTKRRGNIRSTRGGK